MALKLDPYWRSAVDEARKERSQRVPKPPPNRQTSYCHISRRPFVIQPTRRTGYTFEDGRSAVLSMPTVFNAFHIKHDAPRGLSDWPCKEESKYEGDGRIATDLLHRRFPAVPRVQGNITVNWQQRNFIEPCLLENYWHPLPSEVDIFMRTHHIPDLECSREESLQAVGHELMALLDDAQDSARESLKDTASPAGGSFDQTSGPQFETLYDSGHVHPAPQTHGPPMLKQVMDDIVNHSTSNDSDALTKTLLWAQAQSNAHSTALTPDNFAAIAVQEGFTRRPEVAASDWDKNAHSRPYLNTPIPRTKRAPPSDATWGSADARA
ncbi:hypothetical protein CKM354_000387200 [Cercospora kikuchii]|uniref:Uncharacterized protein n=1 Tax=Cercospora kikuchii TaxID=84275 RepID=A0A9P3CCZ5_9PEZI|nr:uncharacterized protein CKM354_000387200 [Cercospora kikuchii]GIZ40538.1 hypothetical protein CKM354_000387200 [Cercospora kikuchii]